VGGKDNEPSPLTAWHLAWSLLNIHLHCLVLDGVYCTTGDVAVCHPVRAPTAKIRCGIIPGRSLTANDTSDDLHGAPHHSASARTSRVRLLKRVFDIDVQQCPQCGGTVKTIAAIEDPSVIARILAHLGLPTRAPPRSLAQAVDLSETT